MKKLIAALLLCAAFYLPAKAQSYTPPQNYTLVKKEDYAPYEPEVLKAIDFLEKTSWTEEAFYPAKTFVLKWIEGSPNVSIEINSVLAKLSKDNPELFGSYMYGYTKYTLLHKTDFNQSEAKKAGILAVLAKYQNEPTHKKTSDVEKLIKIESQGKLDDWIAKDFAKG